MAFGQNYKENVASMGGEGGIYLKIPEDKAVRIALLGDEITGYGRYDGTKVQPSRQGEKDSFPRFAVNVWTFPSKEDAANGAVGQVQILSSVKKLYQQLGELDSDLSGELTNYMVGIKKVAKKYEVRGIRPLTVEEKAAIAGQPLHDLKELVSWAKDAPAPAAAAPSAPVDDGDEIPF